MSPTCALCANLNILHQTGLKEGLETSLSSTISYHPHKVGCPFHGEEYRDSHHLSEDKEDILYETGEVCLVSTRMILAVLNRK